MNKTQKGFGLVESLLIILILAVIGFGGYYVWHNKSQTDKTRNNASASSQSTPTATSTKLAPGEDVKLGSDVSLSIPSGWHSAEPASICNGTDNPTQCTNSVELSPLDAAKAQTGDEFGVSVGRYDLSDGKSAKNWLFDDWCGCIETGGWSDDTLSVSGYDAIHAQQNDSQYVDEYYVVHKNKTVVLITARTKDTSTTAVETGTVKDYTKYLPQIKQIASSVKISS